MARCNELCTKDVTGHCAVCEARAEANRFIRFWFKGGLLIDGFQALKRRGVFAFLHQYQLPLVFLSCAVPMLCLAWFLPRSAGWCSTVSLFVYENPIFVVALSISLLVPLFWLFLWKLPQWQVAAVAEMKDRIDLESKSRQTMAQILGGAALLIGLYFTSQTLRTAQEGQITDRFTKAIDQLGKKDALDVRLGGIYALERIAKDSPKDHWQIMEVLTAYVREQAPWPPKDAQPLEDDPWPEDDSWKNLQRWKDLQLMKMRGRFEESAEPKADIQAILTVLKRRTWAQDRERGERLVLRNTNLRGADLTEADLERAHLGEAVLIRADLRGAVLTGARLEGAIDLTQALVNAACVDEDTQLPDGLTKPSPCLAMP